MLKVLTTLFVSTAVWASIGAQISEVLLDDGSLNPGPDSPSFPGTQCSPRQPRNLAQRGRSSYKKDPSIEKFASTFVKAVQSSPVLSQLFDFFDHTSSEEFSNGKYPEILEVLLDIGAPNPEFASQQAVETIAESFDSLTPDIVIQVYAKSIAKYLLVQGVLSPKNAARLAKQYACMMEEAAICNDSQYTALKEGYVNFLNDVGVLSPDKALLIALQYANEWKLAANQQAKSSLGLDGTIVYGF